MSRTFEEIDYQKSELGELILRRRRYPTLPDTDVFEVILNDEFLMSSLYTAGEIALAKLTLTLATSNELNLIVGGLGLGYTAITALQDPRVISLTVVEALSTVVNWHERELLPTSSAMVADPRCRLQVDDFFALARDGFTDLCAGKPIDALLLDIDHSPKHLLHPDNKDFYSADGLRKLRKRMSAGGVFGLWSNDPPDEEFLALLNEVFDATASEIVRIPNPLNERDGTNTIYLASC